MPEAFSFNREYDFIRLEGLYRATGRPAHEWDIYILKELIDNALDADEFLWRDDAQQAPLLHISIEYISVPSPQCQQLLVRVRNREMFPVQQVQDIFATQWYTSRKAFIKGLTRGALGNALKTLLGIPYALHNRVADDWKPDLKPLSICCGGTEYLPRYIVDPIAQTIRLECETKACKPVAGTTISIGLDYFVQEIPRTLADIATLAQQYHICNPHAEFHWSVEIAHQEWEKEYLPQPGWANKFRERAPVRWYSLTDFKDLLGALYRQRSTKEEAQKLPLKNVCAYFSGFNLVHAGHNESTVTHIIQDVGRDHFTTIDIESPLAKTLYSALCKYSPPFRSLQLGSIGQEHIRDMLAEHFPLEGKLQYAILTDADNDPNMPFVIEAAVAFLKEGKRQLWTAINFSPTYNDPFLSRWLPAPVQPNELVLGLRGLLDAYNFREDTPMILFMHLICPNIEHNEFSKTDINHLPFKKSLGEILDKLLTDLRHGREEEEMQLEQTIFQALNAILSRLAEGERFIPDQLLEKLRLQLRQHQGIALWLEQPDILNRLRVYIASYQVRNPAINRFVARPAEVLLHLPSHPKHYFSIPITHISRSLLEQHFVDKILYVQPRELEPVIIDNNWLCGMDMALLHASPGPHVQEELLYYAMTQSDLPILVLHDGNDEGYAVVEQMRTWLKQQGMNGHRIVDLQPSKERQLQATIEPAKLMPSDLEEWLVQRFTALGIALKYMPQQARMRREIGAHFEQLLREYLLESLGLHFALTDLLIELDRTFSYTKMMKDAVLDEQLAHNLKQHGRIESYATVLGSTVEVFFEQFMSEHGAKVQQLEQRWFTQRQGG
jgi:hypothetical protein